MRPGVRIQDGRNGVVSRRWHTVLILGNLCGIAESWKMLPGAMSGFAGMPASVAATSGTIITHEEIAEMPSSSHVVTLLATLSPGVVAQDQNNNIAHMWSYNAASQMTADGGRNNVWSNTFQLDGSPDMKAGGDVAFIPPMDSVQEFRVATNAYDASIGRQAGATINMQTRSGGKGVGWGTASE